MATKASINAAVFLDRDNTLIQNDGDLGDPALVKLIQGAASAIASLRGLGYKVVVVTNQGGVARGKYTEADVEAVHQRIGEMVRATSATTIDRFYFCPFHPQGTVPQYTREHPWRKPQPGMLVQAAKDLEVDLSQSWLIGDQMRDIEAGVRGGVRTILLRQDAEELTPLRLEEIASARVERQGSGAVVPNFTARNLVEAVRIIAQQRKPESPEEMRSRERSARKWDASSVRAARQTRGGSGVEGGAGDEAPDAAATAPAGTTGQASAPGATGTPPTGPASTAAGTGAAPAAAPAPPANPYQAGHRPALYRLPGSAPKAFRPWGAPPLEPGAAAAPPAGPPASSPASAGLTPPAAGEALAAARLKTDGAVAPTPAPAAPVPTPATSAPAASAPAPVSRDAAPAQVLANDVDAPQTLAPAERASPRAQIAREEAPSTDASPEAEPRSDTDAVGEPAPGDLGQPPDPVRLTEIAAASDRTLREVLQELRNQRDLRHEFSSVRLMAIGVQLIAIVTLLAALFLGWSNTEAFFRGMAMAIFFQLATLALLQLDR